MGKLTVLGAGLLIGTWVGVSLPADAHHRNDLKEMKIQISGLQSRVNDLEDKAQNLNFSGAYSGHLNYVDVPGGCDGGDAAVWGVGQGLEC